MMLVNPKGRWTLACLALSVAAAAAASAQTPLAARPTASAEATLAPAGPIRVEIPPGQTQATVPAEVDATRPATFHFTPPAGAMVTIGVASKSNGARLSVYESGSERALVGTEPEAGCVRWIGRASRPGDLRVVVHTTGEATPVRLEVEVRVEPSPPGPAGG